MDNYKYKQGEVVEWNGGGIFNPPIYVRVCGVSTIPVAVLGHGYIVELTKPLPDYPYTHASAFECHLRGKNDQNSSCS